MMLRRFYIFTLFIFLAAVSCRSENKATPTPFITPSPTSEVGSSIPLPVAITDLAASPAFFDGALVRLTGTFQKLPKLVCSDETYPSPAQWGLVADGLLAQAGGFDAQLRTLAPDGLTMTVEGRWQRWQGPVGCGKKAVEQDIWYLTVTEVVSPSPLTLVTLTPAAGAEEATAVSIAALPTETPPPAFTPTPDISITIAPPQDDELPPGEEPGDEPPDTEPPDEEPGDEEPPASELDNPTPTASSTPTPDPNPEEDLPPTATTAPTATNDPSTTTTPRPTATNAPGSSNPTATPSGNIGTVVTKEQLIAEEDDVDLGAAFMDANTIHEWYYDIRSSETITVSAVSADADLIITILNPTGQQLTERNNFASGQVETIQNFSSTTQGEHKIQLRTASGAATHYAIMVTSSESYTFIFRGIIEYEDLADATLKANNDHFWHFYAEAGDVITLNVTPLDDSDLFMELYGTEAERLSPFINNRPAGFDENLDEFELSETGLYSVHVGEFGYLPSNYEIEIFQE